MERRKRNLPKFTFGINTKGKLWEIYQYSLCPQQIYFYTKGKLWYNKRMIRETPFVKDEIYHLYARGVDKRDIFLTDFARKRFQLSLFLSNDRSNKMEVRNTLKIFEHEGKPNFKRIYQEYDRGEPFVDVLAYALMSNHFHILVRERLDEGGGVSQFMHKIMTSHTKFFNIVNDRKGSLFEGTFRSKHVDTESYYRWLFSYIHLNPLKLIDSGWRDMKINDFSSARDFLNMYQYSSFLDYAGAERPGSPHL